MVPQKAALNEIYTRQQNKQTSKVITRKQPHQHTHTKWSGKEKKKRQAEGKRERNPKKAQERSETQNKKHTSKTKKWEKRLNENYFKLFRRRWNRKAEKQIQKQTTTTTKKTKNVSVREKAERRWRLRAGRHFATGARSAATWPWSTWMKERESERRTKHADSSHPLPPFQTQCARNVRLLFVFLSKSPRSESVERDRSKR